MKISKLDMRCGNCAIIDYCAEPFSSLCICKREELQDVEEKTYKELAEKMQYKSNQELCDQICSVIRRVE